MSFIGGILNMFRGDSSEQISDVDLERVTYLYLHDKYRNEKDGKHDHIDDSGKNIGGNDSTNNKDSHTIVEEGSKTIDKKSSSESGKSEADEGDNKDRKTEQKIPNVKSFESNRKTLNIEILEARTEKELEKVLRKYGMV